MSTLLNNVETSVSLAGKPIHFVELNLAQEFNNHHKCEVLVNFEELDDKWMNDPVKIIKYIGETITVVMMHKLSGETNVFNGIVSNISFVGKHGQQNNILIQATSPTIKLDGKETMDSFVDKTLDDIVNEAVSNSGNGGEITTKAEYASPIDYICQYGETAFNFLNRLSWLYGESFFYDGSNINFGKLELNEPTKVLYDIEMTSFNLEASLLPPKVNRYSYLVNEDQEKNKGIQADVPSTTGYLKATLDCAEAFYTSEADLPLDSVVNDPDSLQKMVDIERTQTIANMLVMKGDTQTCKVKIGKAISIEFPSYMGLHTTPGSFIVTQVTHTVDQKGLYSNSFTGVPASLERVPVSPVFTPIANPQQATVKTNADPKGLGRVRVQFQWQKAKGKTTNWIRVQTPDAGSSDKVGSNRGLVTIPENGDLVMVGFEYGDPNRPYSAGSLFSSKTGGGGGAGNKCKSLTTRSGSTVSLNDEDGSILIKDQAGSESKITLDGNKNISIEADDSFTINVGKGQCVLKMDNSGTATLSVASEFKVNVGTAAEEGGDAPNSCSMTTDTTTLKTESAVNITTETNTITGTTATTIKNDGSGSVKVEDIVTIVGSPVNIN